MSRGTIRVVIATFRLGHGEPSLATYEQEGLITRQGDRWALTDDGRALIEDALYDDVDGPDALPFKVVVGPMATGNAVMERPEIWDELGDMGVRDITGLEMEAAAIATVAHDGTSAVLPHRQGRDGPRGQQGRPL